MSEILATIPPQVISAFWDLVLVALVCAAAYLRWEIGRLKGRMDNAEGQIQAIPAPAPAPPPAPPAPPGAIIPISRVTPHGPEHEPIVYNVDELGVEHRSCARCGKVLN